MNACHLSYGGSINRIAVQVGLDIKVDLIPKKRGWQYSGA
jgi:hypothetical protein